MRRGARTSRRRDLRPRREGFTLVELLVLIAIIVVLLGLLAPVIARMEARRKRVACASSLHHLGVAVAAYAVDHARALPTHFADGTIPFDTFWMRRTDGEYVNLGLLLGYVDGAEPFYCVSHDRGHSPSIAFDTPQNRWRRSGHPNNAAAAYAPAVPAAFPILLGWKDRPRPHDIPEGVNSSYPARSREVPDAALHRWSMLNHTNKVIYSDFIGVDNWPGRGRFPASIQAPHDSEGCNRLFGDGMVAWVDTEEINALRPVDARTPTAKQLAEYYKLLDVLP